MPISACVILRSICKISGLEIINAGCPCVAISLTSKFFAVITPSTGDCKVSLSLLLNALSKPTFADSIAAFADSLFPTPVSYDFWAASKLAFAWSTLLCVCSRFAFACL